MLKDLFKGGWLSLRRVGDNDYATPQAWHGASNMFYEK